MPPGPDVSLRPSSLFLDLQPTQHLHEESRHSASPQRTAIGLDALFLPFCSSSFGSGFIMTLVQNLSVSSVAPGWHLESLVAAMDQSPRQHLLCWRAPPPYQQVHYKHSPVCEATCRHCTTVHSDKREMSALPFCANSASASALICPERTPIA